MTKQAVFTFAGSDQAVDIANFDEFDNHFNDPENIKESTVAISLAPENTDVKDSFSPTVNPNTIDSLDDNGVEDLLRNCFRCGMADYSANPHGNPFSDHVLTDSSTPLNEY